MTPSKNNQFHNIQVEFSWFQEFIFLPFHNILAKHFFAYPACKVVQWWYSIIYKPKKGSILYKYTCTQPLHKPGFLWNGGARVPNHQSRGID